MKYPNSQGSRGETQKMVKLPLDELIKRSVHGECIDTLSQYVQSKRNEGKVEGLDFEGPTLGEAILSVETYMDPLQLPLVEEKFLNTITWYCKQFQAKFYLQGQGLLASKSRMLQLDLFKKCDKALQKMLETTKQIDEVDRDLYIVYGSNFCKVSDLKYLTKQWALLNVGEEEEEPFLILNKDWNCSVYSPLFKAMILAINKTMECLKFTDETEDLIQQLDQVCKNILSVGRIYQLFNPSEKELDEAGQKLLDLLQSPDKGGENSEYHERCLAAVNQLFDDCDLYNENEPKAAILSNREARNILHNKKYCKDFARALRKTKAKGFHFTEEDYYLSNKSDPAINKNFKNLKSSLLKSVFEYDPFKGCGFDQVTGYESHYLSKEEALAIGTEEMHVVTRMITNPSKCKGRGIHLSFNAIQDRCNLIHRVLQSFLNELKTDCTTHQTRGVQFIQARSFRKKRETEGYNLYAADFTNATDTLSQYVQELVLSRIFGPEITAFWHELASMPKVFRWYLEKQGTLYYQASGQPQGFLGSFDAFALVHHVIMLCTMQVMGLSDRAPEDFYRVLGDDSAICTIVPDNACPLKETLMDPDFKPVLGRSVLDTYFAFSLWCNFIVNFDKTTVVFSSDPVALIDFAKVTVREGRIFSPIPVRLFYNSMGVSENTLVPGFLWNADHEGWVNKPYLRGELERVSNLPNKFIDSLYFGGSIPCFKSLEIEADRDEAFQGRVALSYIIASIQQNVICSFLPDSIKEGLIRQNKPTKDYYQAFVTSGKKVRQDFEKSLEIPGLSFKHKIFYAILKNRDIEEYLKSAFNGNLELPDSILWSPYLRITVEMRDSLEKLSYLIDVTRQNPDAISTSLLGSLKPILDSLKEWDKYTFRSDYKKAKIFSSLATTSAEAYEALFQCKLDDGLQGGLIK